MTTDYGTDSWCDDSLRTGRMATGLRLLAQNAVHRLSTPRGMLLGGEEEANYGFDLLGKLGSSLTPNEAASLPGQIKNELTKDPRISGVTATVTSSTSGPATTWTIAINVETDAGIFSLAASAVTITIVGLGALT